MGNEIPVKIVVNDNQPTQNDDKPTQKIKRDVNSDESDSVDSLNEESKTETELYEQELNREKFVGTIIQSALKNRNIKISPGKHGKTEIQVAKGITLTIGNDAPNEFIQILYQTKDFLDKQNQITLHKQSIINRINILSQNIKQRQLTISSKVVDLCFFNCPPIMRICSIQKQMTYKNESYSDFLIELEKNLFYFYYYSAEQLYTFDQTSNKFSLVYKKKPEKFLSSDNICYLKLPDNHFILFSEDDEIIINQIIKTDFPNNELTSESKYDIQKIDLDSLKHNKKNDNKYNEDNEEGKNKDNEEDGEEEKENWTYSFVQIISNKQFILCQKENKIDIRKATRPFNIIKSFDVDCHFGGVIEIDSGTIVGVEKYNTSNKTGKIVLMKLEEGVIDTFEGVFCHNFKSIGLVDKETIIVVEKIGRIAFININSKKISRLQLNLIGKQNDNNNSSIIDFNDYSFIVVQRTNVFQISKKGEIYYHTTFDDEFDDFSLTSDKKYFIGIKYKDIIFYHILRAIGI